MNKDFCQCDYEDENNIPRSKDCWLYCPIKASKVAAAIRADVKQKKEDMYKLDDNLIGVGLFIHKNPNADKEGERRLKKYVVMDIAFITAKELGKHSLGDFKFFPYGSEVNVHNIGWTEGTSEKMIITPETEKNEHTLAEYLKLINQ